MSVMDNSILALKEHVNTLYNTLNDINTRLKRIENAIGVPKDEYDWEAKPRFIVMYEDNWHSPLKRAYIRDVIDKVDYKDTDKIASTLNKMYEGLIRLDNKVAELTKRGR